MWAVPCTKIPAYLHHGALYQSLDKEDDSLVHVPFDCIRFRDQANNLCEFSILLRTMRFWILDRIPDGVIEYCLYHEYKEWKKVALKVLGVKSSLYRDLCVIFCGEKKNRIFRAVRVNRPEIVRFLESVSVCGSQYRSIAAYAARLGKLESLQALHACDVTWDKKTCAAAAAGGHLECLKYAHELGCAWDASTLMVATVRGHLGCVKYALDNDCPCHPNLCGKAAQGGHMQCVQYLVSKELPYVSIKSCAYAAQGGHVDCLRYLHENGCPWDENTTHAAAHAGKLATLRYAIERGCPHQPCVVSLAARAGSVPCLRYLVETVGIDPGEMENAFASALLSGNHACFAYLWQEGYRLDDFSFLDLPFTASEKRSIARKNYDEKLRQCLEIAVRHGMRCDQHLAVFLKSHNFKNCRGICAW